MTSTTTAVCGEEAVSIPRCEQDRDVGVAVDNPFGSF